MTPLLIRAALAVPPGPRVGGAAILLAALLLPPSLALAVAPGTAILNVARADYFVDASTPRASYSNPVTITTTVRRSGSELTLLRVDESGAPVVVPGCEYSRAGEFGPYHPQPPPALPGGQSWAPGDPLRLRPAAIFHRGEPVFVLLEDPDQNLDALAAETVILRLGPGERAGDEILRLHETARSSGRFMGWVSTGELDADLPGDGALGLAVNGLLHAEYADVADPDDRSALDAAVDPLGRVFDSVTGAPLDGARLRLETAAGLPASPLGDDGRSAFPPELVSGALARDAGGRDYPFDPGSYRYPIVPPGAYRLVVEPPAGYRAPSRAGPEALQQLPGAPFALDSLASRGEVFVVEGVPTFHADIPLDPIRAELFMVLRADRASAGPGEFVGFTLEVSNRAGDAVSDLRLVGRIPPGLRYLPGSLRVQGARAPEPSLSRDGRTLAVAIGSLAAGESRRLDYLVDVGPAARTGRVIHSAEARAGGADAGRTEVELRIEEDALAERCRIGGRVLVADSAAARPLAGARLLLEDGRQAITDASGRYHFEDVAPGGHHLRLDAASLPAPPAGRPRLSRLIDLQGGSLWREDFRVAIAPGARPAAAPPAEPAAPRPPEIGDGWFARQGPELDWLWPPANHHPEVPSTGVMVKHAPDWRIELRLNGEPVPPLHFEGRSQGPRERVALSRWAGLDLRVGDNLLELRALDGDGVQRARLARGLHYSGPPAALELLEDESTLVANGRDPIRVVLRLTDAEGHPARRGVTGPWRVGAPYRAQSLEDELARNALAPDGGAPAYSVGADGRVVLRLAPSSVAGEALLHLPFGRGEETLRVWLRPELRDWIVVGFAEGGAAYRAIDGHADHAPRAGDGDLLLDGRVALYAKGRVRGRWLLTLGYDSEREAERLLDGEPVDPDAWYPIYGDAGVAGQDAASARKLYLRLEGARFFALLGDYDTGLVAAELARYERRLTGLKGEWRGERASLLVFGAEGETRHGREELRGEGLSGPYALAARDILPGSESVVIETRDRLRPQRVLRRVTQRRDEDYTLSLAGGVLRFKSPVPYRDADLNPVFVVIDYESPRHGELLRHWGGRGVLSLPGEGSALGLTVVHEDDPLAPGDLQAVDAALELGAGLRLAGELARSEGGERDPLRAGGAGLIELEQRDLAGRARLYFRDSRPGFGLGQQHLGDRSRRRGGLELRRELWRGLGLDLDLSRERALGEGGGALRDLGEAALRTRRGGWSGGVGLRAERSEAGADSVLRSSRLLLDLERSLLAERLRVRAAHEQSLRGDEAHRSLLGAVLPLGARARLEADAEWRERGPLQARLATLAEPWPGGSVETGLSAEGGEESARRLNALLGLRQHWRLRPDWSLDLGYERARPLRGEDEAAAADFDALSLGSAHSRERWSFTGRAEWRGDAVERRVGAEAGAFGEPRPGFGLSLQLRGLWTRPAHAGGEKADLLSLRLGLARRPAAGNWLLLQRLEGVEDRGRAGTRRRRLLWQGNLSLDAGTRGQVSLFHGLKLNEERVGGLRWAGFIESVALEWRQELRGPWDLGFRGGLKHAARGGRLEHLAGLSLGRLVGRGLWLQGGFNVSGYRDHDFPDAGVSAVGPFLSFDLRFDEEDLRHALRR